MSAEPYLPKRKSLKTLKEAVQECKGCELWENAAQAVFGEGKAKAELMLVGEQPGDQEDKQGRPFVGPAGRLLDQALEEAGIDPDAIQRLSVQELLKLVQQLPPATQAVFNLYVIEGYTHKEIGGLLRISDGTSKWHLSEARRLMQQYLLKLANVV